MKERRLSPPGRDPPGGLMGQRQAERRGFVFLVVLCPNFLFVEGRPECYKDIVPTSPEFLTFAAGALLVLAMLATAAFFAARRPTTALLQRSRAPGPHDRQREWACVCLPNSAFDPFFDASR